MVLQRAFSKEVFFWHGLFCREKDQERLTTFRKMKSGRFLKPCEIREGKFVITSIAMNNWLISFSYD